MTVTGIHALIYTPEAEALRNVLIGAMGWPHVDAGEGWLIFALPPTEVAVHPGDEPRHELSLMCDDINATMAELTTKGIVFRGKPEQQRWGLVTTMVLPGGVDVMLYEPRHAVAHSRPSGQENRAAKASPAT
jgi:hypothetical protein